MASWKLATVKGVGYYHGPDDELHSPDQVPVKRHEAHVIFRGKTFES